MCKVSVIVPVYNNEQFLGECLKTLVSQTLEDIEIIIVDDGSTDNSRIIAQSFVAANSHFKLYLTQHCGVSHARNYGVRMSNGDYISFVDSDDEVQPDYCRAMYEKAIRDNNDLVVCKFDKVVLSGGQTKHISDENPLYDYDNFNMINNPWLLTIIPVGPWDKLISRTLFDKILFSEGIRYAEDQLFSVKVFCLAKKIGVIDSVLYHYYFEFHDGVTTHSGSERLDWISVVTQLYDFSKHDETGCSFNQEIEYFILSKSFRLFSSTVIRTDLARKYRENIIEGIYDVLSNYFPFWRNNPYYTRNLKQRCRSKASSNYTYRNGIRVRQLFCNYGKTHLLFLIRLSYVFPYKTYCFICKIDQFVFSFFRWLRWRFTLLSETEKGLYETR